MLLLLLLYNFEKEVALEDSSFLWVLCFNHVRYYNIHIQNDNKFDWPVVGRWSAVPIT